MNSTHNVTGARRFAGIAVSLVAAALSSAAFAGGSVLNVPSEYATIQLAINAAPVGSVVLVAAGTYSQGFSLGGKNVIVRGAINNGTILSGASLFGSIATLSGSEPATAGLEQLVFRNGTIGSPIDPPDLVSGGGSVIGHNSSAHISNCRFEDSRSGFGGGVYLGNCNINITSCVFINNDAGFDGGGLMLDHCSGTVLNCAFTSNSSGDSFPGPGIGSGSAVKVVGARSVGGIVTLSGCTVSDNTAIESGSAIDFFESPKLNRGILKIIGGTITGNHSGEVKFTGAAGLRVNGQMTSCVLSAGANICNNFANNVSGPYRVLESGTVPVTVCECHGDVLKDGVVDCEDLSLVLSRWGGPVNAFGEADATHDGLINGADVSMVLAMWGTCPG